MGFGSGFALAMNILYEKLRAEEIVLRLRCHSKPFRSEVDGHDGSGAPYPDAEVLDAIFIDDTVIVLFAVQPTTLKRAIDILMRILPKTFAQFGLAMNWAPNKTEAFL